MIFHIICGYTFYVGNNNGNFGIRYFALGTPDGYIVCEETLNYLYDNGVLGMLSTGLRFHSSDKKLTLTGQTKSIRDWNLITGWTDRNIFDIPLRKNLYVKSGMPPAFKDSYITLCKNGG